MTAEMLEIKFKDYGNLTQQSPTINWHGEDLANLYRAIEPWWRALLRRMM